VLLLVNVSSVIACKFPLSSQMDGHLGQSSFQTAEDWDYNWRSCGCVSYCLIMCAWVSECRHCFVTSFCVILTQQWPRCVGKVYFYCHACSPAADLVCILTLRSGFQPVVCRPLGVMAWREMLFKYTFRTGRRICFSLEVLVHLLFQSSINVKPFVHRCHFL